MINLERYVPQALGILHEDSGISDYLKPQESEHQLSAGLTSASAAMEHLLEDQSQKNIAHHLKRLEGFLRLRKLDRTLDLSAITAIQNDANIEISGRIPRLYCAFHYGSYHQIVKFLVQSGVPVSILLTGNVIQSQVAEFRKSPEGQLCEFIDAENRLVIRRCQNAIEAGRSLVIYVDGNSGVGGEVLREDGSMIRINFLAGEIYVRTGIYQLARMLRRPIVTLISVFEDVNVRRIVVGREQFIDRGSHCQVVMQSLFTTLASRVREDPAQWEGWIYYTTYIRASREMQLRGNSELLKEFEQRQFRFNHQRFGLLRLEEGRFLLDKRTLAKLKLSKNCAEVLDQAIYGNEGLSIGNGTNSAQPYSRLIERLVGLEVLH